MRLRFRDRQDCKRESSLWRDLSRDRPRRCYGDSRLSEFVLTALLIQILAGCTDAVREVDVSQTHGMSPAATMTVDGQLTKPIRPVRISDNFVDSILQNGWTTSAWNVEIDSALARAAAGSSFEGKWQINQQPREGYLNVLVLKPGLTGSISHLPPEVEDSRDNCSAAGPPNLIICDASFLNSFLRQTGVESTVSRMPGAASRKRQYHRAFLVWVLGHEIGHIALGHPATHFTASGLAVTVPTSTISHTREMQADSFLVARLANDEQTGIELSELVIDLLNVTISRKVGEVPVGVGIHFDYTNQNVVTYAREGTHPEFVVRGARILDLLGQTDFESLQGLRPMVAPFIQHMREAPPPDAEWR
jgi:hypothetical protein